MPPKSTVWYDEECDALLPKVSIRAQIDGLHINPYNPCVANKIVNGNQLTLRWHIDNLMISHINVLAINKVL
jgi:hypothetical protein